MAVDAAAATGSLRTLGTGPAQAAAGTHAHTGTYVAQSLFDAAGDLLTATANDTPSKLSMGSALQVLRVNAGATALEYVTPIASAVTFTPTGTIAATDVQAAIAEVAAEAGGGNAIFGDGSDGVVDFDGTTTVLGLAPSSGVYTLTRDVLLAGGSQVSGSAVVKTGGFRIFCKGTFTVGASAAVHHNGNNASGSSAGAALTANTIGSGSGGGSGSATNGATAGSRSNALGGAGAAGGAGGTGTAGAGGAATQILAAQGSIRFVPNAVMGAVTHSGGYQSVFGGAGGGGGGGDGTNAGGGGGGGGGVLMIAAKGIVNSGTISANGGNGATRATGNVGGGGGAGGGLALVVYNTFSGNAPTANGGTKGNGVGTGSNGTDGAAGLVVTLVNA
jgi:hypothetical protein